MSYNGLPPRSYTSFVEPTKPFSAGNAYGPYPSTDYGSRVPPVRGADNVLLRETACSIARLPLDLRFAKLQQIFTSNDTRDLQEVFPACVEAILGFQSSVVAVKKTEPTTTDWNTQEQQPYIPISFCHITVDYRLVYEAGYSLLHPDGPLFRFILSVSYNRSPQLAPRFAFPIACLPYSVQQNLENGFVAPWYRNKINIDYSETEGLPEFISLTAFDFYFSHFAYHLVNPDVRTNAAAQPDCLYMALIDVYSDCFFNPKAILENQNVVSSHGFTHKRPQTTLTGSNVTWRSAPDNNFPTESEDSKQKFSPLATSECLESLINIFVEFWLNTSGFNSTRSSRKYPRRNIGPERGRCSPSFGQSPLSSPTRRRKSQPLPNTPTVFPPTVALQAFRQVVKSLHEFIFAQSAEPRGLRKNLESSLLEMKRHIIPQLIQRPLYDLLKDSIRKYPMDASFRFVYELWLSYLQPWRYEIAMDVSKSDEIVVMSQDPRWMSFMTDNLLFFTTLFQGFLDRMLRVDFSVPFNTFAIFRVTKVFWETGIFKRITSIESAVSGSSKSGGPHVGFSPAKSAIRNHFADLEGQSFSYVSIRSPDNVVKALALLKILHREQTRCQQQLSQPGSASVSPKMSLDYFRSVGFDLLKSIFGFVTSPIIGMQLQPAELEKMSRNLSKAMECLAFMYEVELEDFIAEDNFSSTQHAADSFLLDREQSLILSPAPNSSHTKSYRRNSVSWIGEEKLPFLTEPELRAARSWEIKSLIPLLNDLSTRINEVHGDKIIELYNGDDFISRLVHPLIEPPHKPGGALNDEQSLRNLPARISLRPLASKHKIYSLLFVIFFMWFADFGFFRGFFCLLAIPAFFLIANAILEPFRHRDNVHHH